MTRPHSSSLRFLGWLAVYTLLVGVLAWVIPFFVFTAQMADISPDPDVIQAAFDWMNVGGALAGFGMLALVGYLIAAAVGDFLAALIPAPVEEQGSVGTWLSRRLVGDGVDTKPGT